MNYTPPNPAIQTTAFSRDNSTQGYFTESQLRSEVERVRRETIEECAKVCEGASCTDYEKIAFMGDAAHYIECAIAIRELLK